MVKSKAWFPKWDFEHGFYLGTTYMCKGGSRLLLGFFLNVCVCVCVCFIHVICMHFCEYMERGHRSTKGQGVSQNLKLPSQQDQLAISFQSSSSHCLSGWGSVSACHWTSLDTLLCLNSGLMLVQQVHTDPCSHFIPFWKVFKHTYESILF